MTKSAVLFDFGRVFYGGGANWTAQIQELYGLSADDTRGFFSGPDAIETQLAGASFTTKTMRPVIADRLAARLGSRAEAAAELICAVYLDRNMGEYDEPMIALADDLHQAGVRVGILTNGPADTEFGSMAPILERGCVDETVISGRDGVGKPSAAAFELITKRIGATPADSCFVDDQLFQVEAARALGFSSFVYEGDEAQVRSWLRTEGLPV